MKITTLFVLSLFLISTLALAVTAQKPDKIDATLGLISEKQPMGQTTFLQCVSDAAAVKNTCYSATSDKKTTCNDNAANQTEARAAKKVCAADYKKDKKQCKTDFKKTKNECKKIKHSFLDSIRASFK